MNYQMKLAMVRYRQGILLLILIVWSSYNSFGQTLPERPNPPRYCNDLANIFSNSERADLEQLLKNYKDSTSTQIVVITVNDLLGMDKAQFTTEIGEKWGVGQAKEDNGVVFMIAPTERKFFIATGRGTQDKLTDAFISNLGYNYIKPEFKQNNFYPGVRLGLVQIMDKLKGSFKAAPKSNQVDEELTLSEILMMVFLFIVLLWFISKISKAVNYSETYSGRGYRGGLGGGFWGSTGGSSWGSGGSSWGSGGGDSWGGGSFDGGGAGGDW